MHRIKEHKTTGGFVALKIYNIARTSQLSTSSMRINLIDNYYVRLLAFIELRQMRHSSGAIGLELFRPELEAAANIEFCFVLFLIMFYSSFCATYSNIVVVLIIN